MGLLLIGIEDSPLENRGAQFALIADALSDIKADVDIVGWFERQSIMGLILPEIEAADLPKTCNPRLGF